MTCRPLQAALVVAGLALLAGCSTAPPAPLADSAPPLPSPLPTPAAPPVVLQARNDVALFALSLLDTPYTRGGRGPATGFDCSGLVNHVYARAAGVKLGGTSAQLGQKTRRVDARERQPGDLVFFNTLGESYSHVGVYVGNGRFVHASNPRTGVRVDRLDNRYWAERLEGVHRVLE